MGNVKSFCCKDNVSELDDREERCRIISDNCNGSCDDIYNGSTASAQSNQDSLSYGSINNGHGSKTLEQSALDKIYQKMAANVIDVAPGESMVIQQAEFIERQKAYQVKLNQIKTPLPLKLTNRVPKHVHNSFDSTLRSHHSSPSAAATFNLSPGSTINNNITTASTISSSSNGGNPNNSINSNTSPQHNANKSQENKRSVGYEPISVEDLQLINDISLKSVQALKSLKITSQEQVVAHFKP